jgi:uncharacterized membrane protein
VDWYSLFKFLHVAAAIVWIGAGIGLLVLGIAAKRAQDRQAYVNVIQQVTFLGPRLFVPSAIAALVTGATAAWLMWSLSYLWIWIGLIGFAATFATGNFLIRPRSEAVAELIAGHGYSEQARDAADEILTLAKFDYLMLFVVVADMVYKPALNDWPLLLVMVIALAAGGAFFLSPVLRKPAAVRAVAR